MFYLYRIFWLQQQADNPAAESEPTLLQESNLVDEESQALSNSQEIRNSLHQS